MENSSVKVRYKCAICYHYVPSVTVLSDPNNKDAWIGTCGTHGVMRVFEE